MDKKPQVFPTGNQGTPQPEGEVVKPFVADPTETANTYTKPSLELTDGLSAAAEAMRKRTEEQMKLRDEQLRKNIANTENYQKMAQEATDRQVNPTTVATPNTNTVVEFQQNTPVKAPVFQPEIQDKKTLEMNSFIQKLSEPDFNSSYDLIPLPSEGKLYPNKKTNVRVSYMTTADENILTSPHLLESGEFLEILINRKLLEPDLRYKDLHMGDRNAIMLWLRATGYGEMYPVTLLDQTNNAFETSINLSSLKVKKLGAEPDSEGLFDFVLPLSKAKIKFRLLTVGDIDEIERLIDLDKANNVPVNNTSTYTMEKTIVEVNGSRDKSFVSKFASTLRLKDGADLREYINKIESGVDLDITVGTPGGGSVDTFLPLNVNFFWPNIRL